ncbi:unnamed protein product [Bursaphelenchus okinawaensis]|uniref:Conserved oligomeric Golgi complex subunit 4 n=1 Tax=Bursaphelenchus okinawaensis TaxID=465554 RepID=A0A811KCR8_9BILA|nr:unnamed protein product [Bursaphelenchus okinawaensis]CAG9099385.1 unnamed protein product [Bursaphelenchus okinawaensis]
MDTENYFEQEERLIWSNNNEKVEEQLESCLELQFNFGQELAELRAELEITKQKEDRLLEEVQREIDTAIGPGGAEKFLKSFDQSIARVCSLNECMKSDAKQLNSSLHTVSTLADNISKKVAVLDQAKGRVVECLQLVNDLRDLRTCAEGVQKAMVEKDYDEAAQNIHRFLTLDSAVFRVGDVGAKEPGQSLKHSYEILRTAQTELKTIIEQKFDESLSAADEKSIQRYFKLFPMINDHSTGLRKFGSYLNKKIGQSGDEFYKLMQAGGTDDKRINVLYADTLTLLLEHIARLIETYQPIIDNFYGPDKLLDLIEIIEVEADKQSIRIISAFLMKRQLDEKIRVVDGYMRTAGKCADKIEPRDLDVLLAEITIMHTRTELYWRFLKRRLGEAHRPLSESGEDGPPLSPKAVADSVFMDELSEEELKAAAEKQKLLKKERNKKLDALLNRSELSMKMQEILGKYVLLEQYYMTESVKKGIEMEDVEEGALTTSLLDDVFFIVRKSIRRSITSSSVDCVCAMLNNGCTLLETDFFVHINKIIKHGKSVAEAGPESQRTAFLLALNNMAEAVKFLSTLKQGLKDEFERHLGAVSKNEKHKLDNSVAQLDDLGKKFSQSASIGIGKLVDSAFKPKLKSNADAYLNFNHEISDDEFAEFEVNDPFMANFIAQSDKLIAPFEKVLTEENYNELLGAIMAETGRRLEAVILQLYFNRNGALQLDRETRSLTEYFTNIAGWSIRSKAARLAQIVGLLNLDTLDEAVAYFHDSAAHQGQALTSADLKKFLKLRSDFSTEKINQIKV